MPVAATRYHPYLDLGFGELVYGYQSDIWYTHFFTFWPISYTNNLGDITYLLFSISFSSFFYAHLLERLHCACLPSPDLSFSSQGNWSSHFLFPSLASWFFYGLLEFSSMVCELKFPDLGFVNRNWWWCYWCYYSYFDVSNRDWCLLQLPKWWLEEIVCAKEDCSPSWFYKCWARFGGLEVWIQLQVQRTLGN